MKFSISQNRLANGISIVQKAISSKSTKEILEGILISVEDQKIKLTGTDSEIIRIETYLDANIYEEGSVIIDSRIFGDIIRKLPQDDILIEVNEKFNVNIKCGISEFNIRGNAEEGYPMLLTDGKKESFTIPSDLLKDSIKLTSFAVSQDYNRKNLTGIFLEKSDDFLSFVALDGYRLAVKKIPMKNDLIFESIIPGKSMNELYKILPEDIEETTIELESNNISFITGKTSLYSQLIDGKYFSYRDILRDSHDLEIEVDKRLFQDGVERASLLARGDKANLIKFEIEGDVLTISSNSEMGDVTEEVPIKNSGGSLKIAFNSKYILEGIKNMDDTELKLGFKDSVKPLIITPVDNDLYTYLVLPVRLAAGE
ncbi:MAG: DNA polymerase III subunit beta [Tissierellia bacterium]|nr:DNA polymerase III subunit beta [Tissierellia bacterium]